MVALYVRVSSTEQAEHGYSIGEQQERLKKYAEVMGWDKYEIFTDGGFSGANIDRPALQELITNIKKYDRVVVYKLDRLSRSQKDTLYLIEDIFLAAGCDFVSMSENFDTSTPFGRAMIGILSVFAQLEREQIKERMSMGKSARAKKGLHHGGRSALGYDYIDGKLVVNEYYAMQIKELFDLFLAGTPLRAIERIYNDKGYVNQYGTPWNPKQMSRTIKNKVYIGMTKHKESWYKAEHKPIIDKETFDKANKMLQEHEDAFSGSKDQSTYLGGLIYCAKCGARYGKASSGGRYGKYVYNYACYSRHKKVKAMIKDPNCKNKTYRIENLDKIILDEIRKLTLESITETKRQTGADKGKIIEKQIKSLEDQISRLLDLYTLGRFPIDQLDAKVIHLQEQKDKLAAELKSLDNKPLEVEDAMKMIISLDDVIESGDFDQIRGIITALISRIDIDDDDITIQWNFM